MEILKNTIQTENMYASLAIAVLIPNTLNLSREHDLRILHIFPYE